MRDTGRWNRTPFALAEVAAAGLLIGAGFLPWFSRGSGATVDQVDAWHAVDDGIAFVVPPLFAAATALVGLGLAGRSKVANPVAFAVAGICPLLALLYPSGIDPQSSTPITSAYGLWIEAVAAIGGLVASLADLAWAGPATRVSRSVGRPSLAVYAALSAAALVGAWLAWRQLGDIPGFVVAAILLVAIPLAAPRWPLRVLVTALAFGLAGAWFIAETQPLSAGALLFVVGGAAVLAMRRRSRLEAGATAN